MVYAQTRICPKTVTHNILRDFQLQTDHLIPGNRSKLGLINNEKRTGHPEDFAVPDDRQSEYKGK